MLFCKFVIVFLISNQALCLQGFRGIKGIISDQYDSEQRLGYFAKSDDTNDRNYRSRSESDRVVTDRANVDYNSIGSVKDYTTEETVLIIDEPIRTVKDGLVKHVPDESSNVSIVVMPLHVTNTAKQQCMDGYKPDENGICQKTMQAKDKSFKLRRRKRAEQTAPKLSYADVVKYGRNPPKELLTTMKAELLTKKPDIVKAPATTPPTLTTSRPKSPELSKANAKDAGTTVRIAPATSKPAVVTPKSAVVAPATSKPSIVAPAATLKPATPVAVASKTAKPSVVATTVPPVVKKFTNKPSIIGDANQAFLSGEKSSVISQSMDGKLKPVVISTAPKKTVDPTRLRRWIRFI